MRKVVKLAEAVGRLPSEQKAHHYYEAMLQIVCAITVCEFVHLME